MDYRKLLDRMSIKENETLPPILPPMREGEYSKVYSTPELEELAKLAEKQLALLEESDFYDEVQRLNALDPKFVRRLTDKDYVTKWNTLTREARGIQMEYTAIREYLRNKNYENLPPRDFVKRMREIPLQVPELLKRVFTLAPEVSALEDMQKTAESVNEEKMQKVWVQTLFGRYKGLLISQVGDTAEVELVGDRFGVHPNGKMMTVPIGRVSARVEESVSEGSGKSIKAFKPDDYAIYADFGLKSFAIVRVLPWPHDDPTIRTPDKITGEEGDPVRLHIGGLKHSQSSSVYCEYVLTYGMGDSEHNKPASRHFINPDNLYKSFAEFVHSEKHLYPHVLVDLTQKIMDSPMADKLKEFGLLKEQWLDDPSYIDDSKGNIDNTNIKQGRMNSREGEDEKII